jgi:hypothetical protein
MKNATGFAFSLVGEYTAALSLRDRHRIKRCQIIRYMPVTDAGPFSFKDKR